MLRDFAKIKAVRVIAGCLAGMLTAFLLLMAVEVFGAVAHPFPADFSGTKDEVCQHVARYPQWVLALVVPAWGLTALVSTWTAARIGGRGAALFIGLILLAGLVCNVSMLSLSDVVQDSERHCDRSRRIGGESIAN